MMSAERVFITGTFEKIGFIFINFLKVDFINPLVLFGHLFILFHRNGSKLGKGFCCLLCEHTKKNHGHN